MEHGNLVESLRCNLAEYGYNEPTESLPIDDAASQVLARPREWMVRYVCVVVSTPSGCLSREQAEALFRRTRTSLTRRYTRFPYWKELGTYLVVLCSSPLFDELQANVSAFKDRTGLHMNVMLGTVLVDVELYRCVAASTWGLFYSGRHYGAISATVNEWCRRMRDARAQGSLSTPSTACDRAFSRVDGAAVANEYQLYSGRAACRRAMAVRNQSAEPSAASSGAWNAPQPQAGDGPKFPQYVGIASHTTGSAPREPVATLASTRNRSVPRFHVPRVRRSWPALKPVASCTKAVGSIATVRRRK